MKRYTILKIFNRKVCNNNCISCNCISYNYKEKISDTNRNSKYKSFDEIKKNIDILSKKYDNIIIDDYETTLHPNILQIINYIKKKNFDKIGITTNARIFKYKNIIPKFLDAGLNQVYVSLFADNKKKHKSITKTNSFDETLAGIKNLFENEMIELYSNKKSKYSIYEIKKIVYDTNTKIIDLNLGHLCNNECLFCISKEEKPFFEKYENIISELNNYKDQKNDELNLLGGEVTLIKKLPDIIKHAKNIGFKQIHILTNARAFCDYDFCKQVIESGLTRISVTIHGSCPKIHDTITQRNGSFKQTLQGIKNIMNIKNVLKNNIKVIGGSCICKQNLDDLINIAMLLKNNGINEYLLLGLRIEGNAKNNFEFVVPEYKDIIEPIKKVSMLCETEKMNLIINELPPCITQECYNHNDINLKKQHISLKTNACNLKVKKFNWTKLQKKIKSKYPECKKCIYYDRCDGIWIEQIKRFDSIQARPVKNNNKLTHDDYY